MTSAFPFDLAILFIFQLELVSWYQSDIIFVWKYKKCHFLFIDVVIPSHFDVILGLRLFELLVIISFELDERFEYFFVLFGIFVP